MSGISIFRVGAAGLLAVILSTAPLAYAASGEGASSPSLETVEQGPVGLFSFVMSLLSDIWENDPEKTILEDPTSPLLELPPLSPANGDEPEQQTTNENGTGIDPIGGG